MAYAILLQILAVHYSTGYIIPKKQQDQISLFQISEINVTYKPKFKASERPAITTSKNVYDILFQNWDMNKIELPEQFKIRLLNRADKVLRIYEVSSGGVSGTAADPKLVFLLP